MHPAEHHVRATKKRQKDWVEGRARGGRLDRPGKKRADGGSTDSYRMDDPQSPGWTPAARDAWEREQQDFDQPNRQIDRDEEVHHGRRSGGLVSFVGGASETRDSQSTARPLEPHDRRGIPLLSQPRASGGGVDDDGGTWKDRMSRQGDINSGDQGMVRPVYSASDKTEIRNVPAKATAEGLRRGGGIHIKASHKGELHRDLGVKQGQPISEAKMEKAKETAGPAERKRITFAENARQWDH